MTTNKKTQITIDINLDENKIPEKISWSAKDGGISKMESKAILLSFWNSENQETLKMDLWVKDMPLDQMKLFFHQTFVSMSDTFYKATNDEKMTQTIRDFCDYYAEYRHWRNHQHAGHIDPILQHPFTHADKLSRRNGRTSSLPG